MSGDASTISSATDGMSSRDQGSSVDWHRNVQDWHPDFQEAVATMEKGYKLLMQNHGEEMWKHSEDFASMIDEEQFLKLAVAVTVDDLSGMNWGRIVALFTISGLLTFQLVRREQQDVVRSLQEWLTVFVSKHLSGWIEDHGGWVSQSSLVPSPSPFFLQFVSTIHGSRIAMCIVVNTNEKLNTV